MARCPSHGRTRNLGGFYNPEVGVRADGAVGFVQVFYVRHACGCCRRIRDDTWATEAEVQARESDLDAPEAV